MSGLVLHLQSPQRADRTEGVVAFQGTDASGSFSIWPRHERLVTILSRGLCSARLTDGGELLIALPGAVAYFLGNELRIAARYYECGTDAHALRAALQARMMEEGPQVARAHAAIVRLEHQLVRQLWLAAQDTGLRR